MSRKKNRERAIEAVRGPAVALLLLGVLAVLLDVVVIAGIRSAQLQLVRRYHRGEVTEQELDRDAEGLTNALLSTTLVMLPHCATIIGAISTLRLGSYSLAQAGASMALIPCFSPFMLVGIPFAMWALSVMDEPRVRSAFGQK